MLGLRKMIVFSCKASTAEAVAGLLAKLPEPPREVVVADCLALLMNQQKKINADAVVVCIPSAHAKPESVQETLAVLAALQQESQSSTGPVLIAVFARRQEPHELSPAGLLRMGCLEVLTGQRLSVQTLALSLERASERREYHRLLQKERDQARAASAFKSVFLANMSHEIRNPLNVIIGLIDMIKENQNGAERERYLGTLEKSSRCLMGVINDVLDLSKIEQGKFELSKSTFDLAASLSAPIDVMAVRARAKGLDFRVVLPDDLPAAVEGDRERLTQVLLNLLGNAIKFTEQGFVALRLEREAHADGADQYTFFVSDSGIGLSRTQKARIFEPFTQAEADTHKRYGGTGLGLTICKQLVELMGGRIRVQSQPGRGATFSFTIVLARKHDALSERAQPAQGRVLIVDDDPDVQLFIQEMFDHEDVQVVTAGTASQGLDIIMGQDIDAIVSDVRMPQMDGMDFINKVNNELKLNIPFIMMSGGVEKQTQKAFAMGKVIYFDKPLHNREQFIHTVLDNVERGKQVRQKSSLQKSMMHLPRRKVLLAEDALDNQLLVKAMLANSPFELTCVDNGKQAVEQALSGDYDIVVMDMQMPVMGGFEATTLIRGWEKEQGRPALPIIALTGAPFKEDIRRAAEVGCTALLAKPVKREELLQTLCRYCQNLGRENVVDADKLRQIPS